MRAFGVRSKVGLGGLAAALCGTALALASCGQVAPFTRVEMPGLLALFQPAPPPPAPVKAQVQTEDGRLMKPNSWTNQSQVELGVTLPPTSGGPLLVEAEFAPEEQPLVGAPNVTGKPGQSLIPSPLMDAGKTYHWAVRLRKPGADAGPWLRSAGTIGYQPTPPPSPTITPLPHGGWLGTANLELSWQAEPDPAGIAGFAYSLDQSPTGAPPAGIKTTTQSVQLTVPRDGAWYVHLRSLDTAGNASDVTTVEVHRDSVPLSVEPPKVDFDGAWNPMLGPLSIKVQASKAAQLALAVLPEKSDAPVRTLKLDGKANGTIQWDGKDDRGQAVPAGNYRLRLNAADQTGRTAQALLQDPIPLIHKRIVVSLSQERLVAYDGDKPVFDTLVTTGGPELPTPVGTFHILSKMSPFTFHSPWPKGSPYWYADSPTNYAMLFESSGYFIHDAPWRSWYGPGSNATDGQPGGNGTGTHGCVNVPLGVQAKLFAWTDVGTPVIVQN